MGQKGEVVPLPQKTREVRCESVHHHADLRLVVLVPNELAVFRQGSEPMFAHALTQPGANQLFLALIEANTRTLVNEIDDELNILAVIYFGMHGVLVQTPRPNTVLCQPVPRQQSCYRQKPPPT